MIALVYSFGMWWIFALSHDENIKSARGRMRVFWQVYAVVLEFMWAASAARAIAALA